MKTQTKQESKLGPRIERGTPKLIIPHRNKYVTFVYPSFGPNTYQNIGKQILENKLQIPTAEQTASLSYTAYCSELKNELEFQDIIRLMRYRWLWVFNRTLWTDKGVYVVSDEKAVGISESLEISNLEKSLKNAKEINGVMFSKNGKIRFASKETYKLGDNSTDELTENGFVIASYGKEGAEQLAEFSTKFLYKLYVYGLDIKERQAPELRVSALDGGGSRLQVDGYGFDVSSGGCAFGALK